MENIWKQSKVCGSIVFGGHYKQRAHCSPGKILRLLSLYVGHISLKYTLGDSNIWEFKRGH